MAKEAGVPKKDGSGKGVGANAGQGCDNPTRKNAQQGRRQVPVKKS